MTILKLDLPVILFKTQVEWEKWLSNNHATSKGVWLKMFKKDSGVKSINYDQALDEALCYGWIDGQARSLDEKAYLQRFTPRRPKGMWSQRNTEHIARLTKLGKMQPSGIAQVEAAKADGRWERSYASPANTEPPKDFIDALEKNKKAKDFFATLNKTNTFAIIWQINNAKKEETRKRRIEKFVIMLARGEKLY